MSTVCSYVHGPICVIWSKDSIYWEWRSLPPTLGGRSAPAPRARSCGSSLATAASITLFPWQSLPSKGRIHSRTVSALFPDCARDLLPDCELSVPQPEIVATFQGEEFPGQGVIYSRIDGRIYFPSRWKTPCRKSVEGTGVFHNKDHPAR